MDPDPDPGGPKTRGSGSATLVTTEDLPIRALSLGEAGASLGKSRGLSRPGDPLGDRGLKNRTFLIYFRFSFIYFRFFFIYFRSFLIYFRLISGVHAHQIHRYTYVSALNTTQTDAEAPM
jgi:hypothetical protein